jgi:hypothetical protein
MLAKMDFLSAYPNAVIAGLVTVIVFSSHVTLGAMVEKYGPVFTIQLGLQRASVISTCEMAKECFTTNDLAISSRPKLVAAKNIGYNFAMFVFAPYGPYWRELRKIATSELLSNRRLELLSYVRVSEVETTLQELYKLWTKKKSESGQILVELKQWFGDMILNVILRMVVGKRYFSAGAVQWRSEEFILVGAELT